MTACVVCGRGKSKVTLSAVIIDGVKCITCEECGKDDHRRPYAVAWTLRPELRATGRLA